MAERPGIGARWEAYRPSKAVWFWSCIACVIATIVIGFTWGGWVTGGTAAQMASAAADNANAKLAAAFCVNQFEKSPDAAAKFASLKKTDSWERDDFITKGGWVTLPGVKEPISGAADLCVQQLMSTKLPPVKAAVAG
ncbi:MAG TPA: hypothetical protein VFA50_11855 [Stellaceae bacterium]|nr:hypothetical protein [Stellaceae bacterium]